MSTIPVFWTLTISVVSELPHDNPLRFRKMQLNIVHIAREENLSSYIMGKFRYKLVGREGLSGEAKGRLLGKNRENARLQAYASVGSAASKSVRES